MDQNTPRSPIPTQGVIPPDRLTASVVSATAASSGTSSPKRRLGSAFSAELFAQHTQKRREKNLGHGAGGIFLFLDGEKVVELRNNF